MAVDMSNKSFGSFGMMWYQKDGFIREKRASTKGSKLFESVEVPVLKGNGSSAMEPLECRFKWATEGEERVERGGVFFSMVDELFPSAILPWPRVHGWVEKEIAR